MARIYICPIIGRGTERDPQRAAIFDVPGVRRCRALLRTRADGIKHFRWCIVKVEADSWAGVDAVGRHIPIAALDRSIPSNLRQKIMERLDVGDVTIPANATVRQVLRRLVRAHEPHSDERTVL